MKKKYLAILILLLVSSAALLTPASAFAAPYDTVTAGPEMTFVPTQTAYTPIGRISLPKGSMWGGLKDPEDMAVDQVDGTVYIADSGNGRVVALKSTGEVKAVIGENVLSSPMGVAVNEESVFVADKGNKLIYVYDKTNYSLLRTIDKPDNPLLGANTPFVPVKIAPDKRGNIYVVSEGCVSGLMQLNYNGDFVGFVGSNETQATLQSVLQDLFFSEEQKNAFLAVPRSPTNVAINSAGLLYTVTTSGLVDGSGASNAIKKLNTLGNAIMTPKLNMTKTVQVSTDASDNIFSIQTDGYVTVFDSYGDMLFRFGGSDADERLGSLSSPVAVSVDAKRRLMILDKNYAMIVVYEPTEFAELVFRAVDYYKDGLYLEGESYWKDVLRLNSSFIVSYKALARANMKRGDYAEALKQFKLAEDKDGYSEAYWYIRNDWLENNLVWVVCVILGVAAVWITLKIIDKRKPKVLAPVKSGISKALHAPFVGDVMHTRRFMKAPADAVYEIKYHKSASILSASLLYVWFVALQILSVLVKGYLFNDATAYNSNGWSIVFYNILILLALVLCNYFVSTVTDGEGKLKHCFIVFIYALTPYLVLALPVFLISNVLTYNESVIYDFLNILMYAWSAICLFLSVMELHDFTFWQTVKNLLLTVFAFAMVILFVIVLRMLFAQLFGYIGEVFGELFNNVF